jgi:Cu-Zn family superoxide dismutase
MPYRHALATLAAAACLAGFPAAAQDDSRNSAPVAGGTFVDAQGREIGTIELTGTPNGVLIRVRAEGLPAGPHGFHIHQTGTCEPPEFTSAGGHYNPTGESHGFLTQGAHAGDLPNVAVAGDGVLAHEALAAAVTITGENALLDDDGSALVIHAGPDDYRTDPSGESGGRIACAVIEDSG